MNCRRSSVRYLLAPLLVFIAAFLAGELFVRLIAGPPASFLYSGSFRDRQTDWDVTYGVDENLRRKSCISPDKKQVKKVAVIGDSFVFGQGVSDCKDFASLLNQAQGEFYFENFGIIGIGSSEYFQIANDLVNKDYSKVVILFYGNDFFWKKTLFSEIAGHSSLISLLRKFYRQFLIREKLDESLTGKEPFNNMASAIKNNTLYEFNNVEPDEKSISDFRQEFEMIVENLAGKVGYDSVYIAVVPSGHTVSPSVRSFMISMGGKTAPFGYEGKGYREIKRVANLKGVRFIETFPSFLKCGNNCYFPHDFHWTVYGHALMAGLISDAFGF